MPFSMENPVFVTYVIASSIMILKLMAQGWITVYRMIKSKFYFDELYQADIDRGVLGFSYLVSWFDRYVVNDTGVDGSAQVTGFAGGVLKYLQTGRVPNYAMAIAIGVVGLTVAGLVVRG